MNNKSALTTGSIVKRSVISSFFSNPASLELLLIYRHRRQSSGPGSNCDFLLCCGAFHCRAGNQVYLSVCRFLHKNYVPIRVSIHSAWNRKVALRVLCQMETLALFVACCVGVPCPKVAEPRLTRRQCRPARVVPPDLYRIIENNCRH